MKKTTLLFVLMIFASASVACGEQTGENITPQRPPTETKPSASDADVDAVAMAGRATGVKFGAVIEKISGGEIDWTRGVVYAVGTGKPRQSHLGAQAASMAKRAAYIVAARNAALVLAGIQPGPGGRFANVRKGWIRTDVKLKHFREISATYNRSTRPATAKLEAPLYGVTGAVRVLGTKVAIPTRSQSESSHTDIRPPKGVFIIDARGTGLSPCLLPWIVDTQDRAGLYASSRGQIDRGMVRYVTLRSGVKLPSGTLVSRMGRDSTVVWPIRASKVQAGKPYSIVLTKENMDKLLQYGRNYPIGRIVIVIDETGKKTTKGS